MTSIRSLYVLLCTELFTDVSKKLIEDLVSLHFNPDLPLTNQEPVKIKMVETMVSFFPYSIAFTYSDTGSCGNSTSKVLQR